MEYVDRVVSSYSEAEPGELVAIVGSGGYLEFILPQHSAAKRLGVTAGSPIELEFAKF
jgi:S-adenosylmethionine hydrolase